VGGIALIFERVIPMKCGTPRARYLLLSLTVLSLLGISPVAAEEPTLARLSFWVPPERMEEFAAAYAEQIAPILKKHGLVESSDRGRATVDSAFSRLFSFIRAKDVWERWTDISTDPQFQKTLKVMGAEYGTVWDNKGPIRHSFWVYSAPAGNGRAVKAGSGDRQGLWQIYGVVDGLPAPVLYDVMADSAGNLWIAGLGMSLCRFDGEEFVTFTREDGLVSNYIYSILQDRGGDLWIGTFGGVSRYDGRKWVTFTVEDGLPFGIIRDILEDRGGRLWFAATGGVAGYDGERFFQLTMEDGEPLKPGGKLGTNRIIEDRQGHIWLATGYRGDENSRGVYRFDGEHWINYTTRDGLPSNSIHALQEDHLGHIWIGTHAGLSRFDGQNFTNFTTDDGLGSDEIYSFAEDRQGHLWIGTYSGPSRFDGRQDVGEQFVHFDSEQVQSIAEDREGYLWFGAWGELRRYDGAFFTHYTVEDDLIDDGVMCIAEDRQGVLWFGTWRGVSRFDGERFSTLKGTEGENIWSMLEDQRGNLWFYSFNRDEPIRYDGKQLTFFTTGDGLPHLINGMLEDREGDLWFVGPEGLSRYKGGEFSTFTAEHGFPQNVRSGNMIEDSRGQIWLLTGTGLVVFNGTGFSALPTENNLPLTPKSPLFEDRAGSLWFGTWGQGVGRYDGESYTRFSMEDGLAYNNITHIMQDDRGHLWFATWGGGVSRYDGLVFQTLDKRDGLVHDTIQWVHQDRNGDFWIATESGITRYRPSTTLPSIRLTEVVADRSYGSIQKLALPSSQSLIEFAFQGGSPSTSPDRLAYVYRLQGYEDWRSTRSTQVRYRDLPTGDYIFQVRAVDRDLNYSEPVSVQLAIHLPYRQLTLIGILCLSVVGLVLTSGYGLKRRRDLRRAEQALMRELEEELQTAHDLQMGLMPTEAPQIDGFDIAGRCLPFNHVGGDLFQYFPQDDKLSICMADVTGHAMEAAVPVMMFSGVLKTEMRDGAPLERLFEQLNRTMYDSLDDRTYVCFTMGELDVAGRSFRLANAACPYPFHFRAANGVVEEMQVDAYPLGVRDGTVYTAIETVLEPGDRIIFCSDGIAEATNVQEEMFGFERTAETIRLACVENLSAEELIDRLIGAVQEFAGDTPQGDDMTVVVLRVEA